MLNIHRNILKYFKATMLYLENVLICYGHMREISLVGHTVWKANINEDQELN